MKKLISLVLAMVLMASMFALLGTVTASAETYEITKTLVNLTFDGDAPYGIASHRGATFEYNKEEGYLKLTNTGLSNGTAYIGINGNVGENPVAVTGTDDISSFTAAQKEAYDNLFKFEAGKTYRISYNYKFLAGTDGTTRKPGTMVMENPLLKTADKKKGISDKASVSSQKEGGLTWTPNDNNKLAEDTEWDTVYYVFTVNEGVNDFAFGLAPGQGLDNDTNKPANTYTAFDNIKIEEILTSYNNRASGVYTFENEKPTWKNASGAPASYVTDSDAAHGTVLKVEGSSASSRGGFKIDNFKFNNRKKYYVSFDAKAAVDNTDLLLAITNLDSTSTCRYFICGYNDNREGVKFFINGEAVDVKTSNNSANVAMPINTEWQSYGFIIDASSEEFINRAKKEQGQIFSTTCHFAFGASGVAYFDNIQVVEVSEVSDVVAERDASAKYSIREESANKTAGLRFKGDVAASVKATADEIGFVIAPVELVYGEADWYKFGSLNKNAKTVVAYNGTKDVVYEAKGDAVSYQLVLTNLGDLIGRRFAAVMYVKTGDTYSYISLGEISYNQVVAEYAVRGK